MLLREERVVDYKGYVRLDGDREREKDLRV